MDEANHTTMSNQKELNTSSGHGLALKLTNIHLRKKDNYGSPDDKMLSYNFP